jgi:uncharacterized membrane protein YesL
MRGMMGGFYKLSEWIMRLAVINVLWLLCSFPFWLVGLGAFGSLQTAKDPGQLWSLLQSVLIMMAVVSPFTFFPSTAAMFSVARKWVTGDVDVPLLRTFFSSYKQNYKQAMIGGILYAVLFAVLLVDFGVYRSNVVAGLGVVAYLFMALTLLLLISLLHFFALLSHFHMKTIQLLKNALVLTIGRPIRSIFMTIGTVAVVFISWRFTWLFPFFFGSIIATFTFYNFHFIISKMMLKAQSADATDKLTDGEQEMKS